MTHFTDQFGIALISQLSEIFQGVSKSYLNILNDTAVSTFLVPALPVLFASMMVLVVVLL